MAAYDGLREFIALAEAMDEARYFDGANIDLEIGAITEVAYAMPDAPLCVFSNMVGCADHYRIATNIFTSPRREALLYGVDPTLSIRDAMLTWKARSQDLKPIEPRLVESGPVQYTSVAEADVDLHRIPFVRWHDLDGGGYLCATAVTMRGVDSDYLNVGTYRFQLVNKSQMVCHIGSGHNGDVIRRMYWEQGKPCPVTISVGHDPALLAAAATNLGYGVSEFGYAGALLDHPIDLILGRLGVPFPADAELVLEADLLPPEDGMVAEGPFGEASGYYGGGVHDAPLVHVRAIWEREDPILLGSPPMQGASKEFLGSRAVEVWRDLEGLGIPNITAVNYAWGLTIISLRQAFPGHAMRAAHGALGGTAGYHGRILIVVDDDVDVYDPGMVMWAISTRCDPETSIDIARRIWSYRIDPRLAPAKRAVDDYTGSVAIVDACRPYHWKDEFPAVTGITAEVGQRTRDKWRAQFDAGAKRPQ